MTTSSRVGSFVGALTVSRQVAHSGRSWARRAATQERIDESNGLVN